MLSTHLSRKVAAGLLALGIAAMAALGSTGVASACPYCPPLEKMPKLPDLIITDITLTPSLGGNVSVTVYVRNTGSAPAGSFDTGISFPKQISQFITLPSLAPGVTSSVAGVFDNPFGTQEYLICAYVDVGTDVDELDEQNNFECEMFSF